MARPYGVGLYGRHRYSTGTYLLTQAFGAGTAIGTAAAQAEYTLAAMTEGVATGGYSLTVLIGTAAAWDPQSPDGVSWDLQAAQEPAWGAQAVDEVSWDDRTADSASWAPQQPENVEWD